MITKKEDNKLKAVLKLLSNQMQFHTEIAVGAGPLRYRLGLITFVNTFFPSPTGN